MRSNGAPGCSRRRRAPTRETWVYQLDPGRSLGKTTALTDTDFEDFVRLQATKAIVNRLMSKYPGERFQTPAD